MLFVERVQAYHKACVTELSQQASLQMTKVFRKKNGPAATMFMARQYEEEKPTLQQWWKLKLHLEQHFHRTSWAFPRGISFLTWISGLRPYLSQKTMKEEMKFVLQNLEENGKVKMRGTLPLTDQESARVRQALARSLGLPPLLFDPIKDDIRVLQRTAVVAIAQERAKAIEGELPPLAALKNDTSIDMVEEGRAAVHNAVQAASNPIGSGMGFVSGVASVVNHNHAQKTAKKEVDEHSPDAFREMIMEMQGQGKPKDDEGEAIKRIKKKHKKMMDQEKGKRIIDDDYLAGPLTIDSYVCYRMRPMMKMLELRANKLSRRLALIEIAGFFIQSSGSVLAVFEFTEWVAVTVAIASILSAFIEFINLRNQVTSVNLALRDMQSLSVFWDSLSIVRRRTPLVKMQVCEITESAFLMVVETHTTASARSISSISKQLEGGNDDDGGDS